jgi:hypothetical protein
MPYVFMEIIIGNEVHEHTAAATATSQPICIASG